MGYIDCTVSSLQPSAAALGCRHFQLFYFWTGEVFGYKKEQGMSKSNEEFAGHLIDR